MKFGMMIAAHRNRKFIADLPAEGPGLCKFEMVWIAGLALTNIMDWLERCMGCLQEIKTDRAVFETLGP
jgi:hypothetical protein